MVVVVWGRYVRPSRERKGAPNRTPRARVVSTIRVRRQVCVRVRSVGMREAQRRSAKEKVTQARRAAQVKAGGGGGGVPGVQARGCVQGQRR